MCIFFFKYAAVGWHYEDYFNNGLIVPVAEQFILFKAVKSRLFIACNFL